MKRKLIRWNKKGEDALVDFWAILIFAFIMVIFFILFLANKNSTENKIMTDFMNKDADFMLNSFIKAPAIPKDITIGQVIAEDSLQEDFSDSQAYFNAFFGSLTQYDGREIYSIQLCIKGVGGDRCIYKTFSSAANFEQQLSLSQIQRADGKTLNLEMVVRYATE
jgi:hypothetical protein